MSVYRNFGFGLILLLTYCSHSFGQVGDFKFQIKENLISDSLVWQDFSECWAVILLSKDQCSNCSKHLTDLILALQKHGREVVVCRVTDTDLMTCKKDELDFLELYEGIKFLYIDKKEVLVNEYSRKGQIESFGFETTPALLVNSSAGISSFDSEFLMDDYGRLKIKLNDIPDCSE